MVVDFLRRRGRVRIEWETVVQVRRAVIIVIRIVGVLHAVVIVIPLRAHSCEVRTASGTEEAGTACINTESALEHLKRGFCLRAKDAVHEP